MDLLSYRRIRKMKLSLSMDFQLKVQVLWAIPPKPQLAWASVAEAMHDRSAFRGGMI